MFADHRRPSLGVEPLPVYSSLFHDTITATGGFNGEITSSEGDSHAPISTGLCTRCSASCTCVNNSSGRLAAVSRTGRHWNRGGKSAYRMERRQERDLESQRGRRRV